MKLLDGILAYLSGEMVCRCGRITRSYCYKKQLPLVLDSSIYSETWKVHYCPKCGKSPKECGCITVNGN